MAIERLKSLALALDRSCYSEQAVNLSYIYIELSLSFFLPELTLYSPHFSSPPAIFDSHFYSLGLPSYIMGLNESCNLVPP